ncbi:MAG: fructosamine kinase family protein [Anaerolineae bacterium]|nr:fructosamine kinase family protein [Anaerolineae bacterium]
MAVSGLQQRIAELVGRDLRRMRPLAGGKISQVLRLDFASGAPLVAKVGDGSHDLRIEAYMLRYLHQHSALPIPEVWHDEPNLLIMEHIAGDEQLEQASLRHLGQLLAACHQVSGSSYGLERDTLIGPLHQPNPPTDSWIEFFRDQRLLCITGVARESGELPSALEARLLRIADSLHDLLIEPAGPALIHGDMWRTNIIVRDGRIAGIIDPALYYAHNEMELAYMALFDGLGQEFFAAYHEILPIDQAFYESRRHIYNLYPLLVHLIIFGQKYIQPLKNSLARFGF